jgi:hypothetical protein
MGHGPEKGRATIPGPLIELNEADTLHIEFENSPGEEDGRHDPGVRTHAH